MFLREGNLKDTQALMHLMELLGYPQAMHSFQERIQLYLEKDGYGLVVAEESENIAGFVAWSMTPLLVLPKVRVHIEGIVVDQLYRGKGVGRLLLAHVEDFAKRHNAYAVDLTSGMGRAKDGTHAFYQSLGYKNEGPFAKAYLRKDL